VAAAADRRSSRHAVHRCWQRYGLVIAVGELAGILALIREGKPRKVRRLQIQDDGRITVMVRWRGHDLIAVVTPEVDQVVTFLPRGAEQRWAAIEQATGGQDDG